MLRQQALLPSELPLDPQGLLSVHHCVGLLVIYLEYIFINGISVCLFGLVLAISWVSLGPKTEDSCSAFILNKFSEVDQTRPLLMASA